VRPSATLRCVQQRRLHQRTQRVAGRTQSDVDELFACHDSSVSAILDKLAPFVDVKQHARPTSPWYDSDCYVTKL